MDTDSLSVKFVWKSQDVVKFLRPAFVQDMKKRKKGYFSCKDCEQCDNQKKFFDVFEAQHEQNEGYESD